MRGSENLIFFFVLLLLGPYGDINVHILKKTGHQYCNFIR